MSQTFFKWRLQPIVLAVALLGGCASQSTYQRPQVAVPATWQQGAGQSSDVLSPWWRDFNDPVLTKLIQDALSKNNNLAQAAVKVRRAQLTAGNAASDQLPTVTLKGASSASRAVDGGSTTRAHSVTAAASWEVDLWGRLAALRNVADWEAQATVEDLRAAELSMVGTVAKLYWQVAYLNQRVLASQQSIDYARQTLKLVEGQYKAGATSALEVAQARQTLAAQEASHTQWLSQRVEARNALAILFDGPPGVTMDESHLLPEGALPDVQAGLPASLLNRRPDLRAAELRLRETLATVDATRAGYYPTLSLTGSLGTSSTALSDVLSNPIATLGAGLSLPFIQWRDMQRNVDISKADYEIAVLGYRQSWYTALSDVENALSGRVQYEAQGVQLKLAVDAAREAERLAEIRYRSGSVALSIWLDAQETRRTAENNLALNRYNRLTALVTLYESLGGGVDDMRASGTP